ncbi:MAG: hypothetical protein HUJ61_04110, partial [Bacilli bacterium]|nr:hypothetical protein [Bacilli bacterium]
MNGLLTLVRMQLKDKLDIKLKDQTKQFLRLVLLDIIKFIVVLAVSFLVYWICLKFVFTYDELPRLIILVLTTSLVLATISCTIGLMKNL